MLVDPEYVQNYLDLPLMERLFCMLCSSLHGIMRNATGGLPVNCSLVSQDKAGQITIYNPGNGLEVSRMVSEQTAVWDEIEEYVAITVRDELVNRAKEEGIKEEGYPLFPIRDIEFLAEIDEKKIYWCPTSTVESAGCFSNELFILLCDEFGKRWKDFLSNNDIRHYKEFWDETSRRVLGVPSLFIEYVVSLLLSDHFHLEDYENDGVNILAYLNILSSQPYEGRPCKGTICMLKKNIQNYTMLLAFEHEEHILDRPLRENRKLLEMTDENLALIIQEGYILGIGDIELGNEKIRFFGNGEWAFESQEGKVLFRCETGNIRIADMPNDSFLDVAIEGQFGKECDLQVLLKIIKEASKQKHGTGIVITNDAEDEANRLFDAGRDILIKPIFLGNHINLIKAVTQIDGALILDPFGTCFAVGAIVDGKSVIKGSPARGARYNSLANYVAWQQSINKKCLAIIVSEDGTVEAALTNEETNQKWIGNG